MSNIAIIPARGGSKRIPRKNIREFVGKPIIAYSIEAALGSKIFDEVMVSTEDDEIARVAELYGAQVPFIRSAKNADDDATTSDVLKEVIGEYEKRGRSFRYCCCLYPTAPFVTPQKLVQSYDLLVSSGAKSVVPVVRFGYPILRSFRIEDSVLHLNWPQYLHTRSQDLPAAYHDCGLFYFMSVEAFKLEAELFTDFSIPLEMPVSETQDIDTEMDWKIAELKFRMIRGL